MTTTTYIISLSETDGGATYCATCNTFFQGLAADMAKDAAFNLAAGTYLGAGDLAGSRVVAFIHDEFLVEVPVKRAQKLAAGLLKDWAR